ncbi:hypothetical protein A2U01_0065633, partial [Trifolium medium]|nr:hypothetical protein [Trifolium medium]
MMRNSERVLMCIGCQPSGGRFVKLSTSGAAVRITIQLDVEVLLGEVTSSGWVVLHQVSEFVVHLGQSCEECLK